jgi:putative transposase
LARVIPLGERHLRHLLHEYAEHYHVERNHQSLGNKLITATAADCAATSGKVLRRTRLGGVLNHYFRDAA